MKIEVSVNPRLHEFLDRKKDITMIGLWWALYWRAFLVIFGGLIILGLVITLIGRLVGQS